MNRATAMLPPVTAEQTYRNYRNARFGVGADVPSNWSRNADGAMLA
jgi:hypothetical protein